MEFNFFKVEELKDEILDILEQMETNSSGDVACERITSIADKLEQIVSMTKKDRTPVVIKSLKEIQNFSERLLSIIRGRSWHAICAEFNPSVTMENIKTLKSTLKKSLKSEKKGKEPKNNFIEEESGKLMDDTDFIKYTNKISNNPNQKKDIERVKKEQEMKIIEKAKKLKRQIELRENRGNTMF